MRVRKCRRTVSLSSVVAPSEGGLLHWNMQWWLGRLGGRNKPCLMLLQLLMQMLLLQLLLLSHPRRVLRCTWRLRKAGARCTVARCCGPILHRVVLHIPRRIRSLAWRIDAVPGRHVEHCCGHELAAKRPPFLVGPTRANCLARHE